MSRILFVMPEVGYLRMYGTTIRALALRGHQVVLAFNRAAAASDRATDDVSAIAAGVTDAGIVPPHAGPWRQLLIELGCTIDYVRFLSRAEGSPYLRGRMDKYLPPRAAWLRQAGPWPAWTVRVLARAAAFVEQALPVDDTLARFLSGLSPDALVITPLVLRGPGGVQQTQVVKAARTLGIPVGLAVGSWDHLSSKGFVRVEPDVVLVWNQVQKREAVEMHRLPPARVRVTGAQLFDLWFTRTPTLDRRAFLERVGLPADRPMILYAGSSRGIANPEDEIAFVRDWLTTVRSSGHQVLSSAGVLVRPHLSNVAAWADIALDGLGPVAIWPRQRPRLPMNDLETSDYYHSLYYSAAVLGINTSAMIEATILDRPVLTVQVPAFADSQAGTRHFHYLLPGEGGPVESSGSFDEHVPQLLRALAEPDIGQAARRRFVSAFVRPRGMDRPALDAVVEGIESLLAVRLRPTSPRARHAPVRWAARRLAGYPAATSADLPEPAGD